nr:PREDICTED: uncharacterized protein LOC109034514 [Bemisia tabaci]
MSPEKSRISLVFLGIFSSAVLCSESGPITDLKRNERIFALNEIDAGPTDETAGLGFTDEDQEVDSRLQGRAWFGSGFGGFPFINNGGISRGIGNGAVIIGNSGMSGGVNNFNPFTSSGNHLELDHDNVHVTVHSPKKTQTITFRGKRAFVNRKLVCKNIHDLDDEPKYQKSADGALWYTNLPVGEEMTEKEIEEFNEEDRRIEEERENAMKEAQEHTAKVLEEANRVREEALKAAERARQDAMEQARRAIELANSFWGFNWGW